MNDKKYIGQQLKFAREEKHLSLEDVGREIGVEKTTIHKYENQGISDIEKISAICSCLDLDVHSVIDDTYSGSYFNNEANLIRYDKTKFEIIERNIESKIAKSKIFNGIESGKNIFAFCNDDSIVRSYGYLIKEKGYEIKTLHLQDLSLSHSYNPFVFLETDFDVLDFCKTVIEYSTQNTQKGRNAFWNELELTLLEALIFYLREYAQQEQQNFVSVLKLLRASETDIFAPKKSDLDRLFSQALSKDRKSHSVKFYKNFQLGPVNTLTNAIASLASRLSVFDLPGIESFVCSNEIEFIPQEKTVTFVIYPTNKSLLLIYNLFRNQLNKSLSSNCKLKTTISDGSTDYLEDLKEIRKKELEEQEQKNIREREKIRTNRRQLCLKVKDYIKKNGFDNIVIVEDGDGGIYTADGIYIDKIKNLGFSSLEEVQFYIESTVFLYLNSEKRAEYELNSFIDKIKK